MSIQNIIKRAVEDEVFAKELYAAAAAATGKGSDSEEVKELLSYFAVDTDAAGKMVPDTTAFFGGLTTTTTTTTYTTAACTTTGTTTTTTGN